MPQAFYNYEYGFIYFLIFNQNNIDSLIKNLIFIYNQDLMSTSIPIIPIITGAKPASIKVEPWTDFPRQAYSIHGDDFCHTKPFVAKFTAKGSRSTLNIKQSVLSKDGKYSVEDDVKLWFDLPNNHSLYTRVKSTSYLKVHYDHGMSDWYGKQWNFYASFWTDKSFSKSSVRVGAASYHPKCNSDNRIRVNTVSGAHNFYWYNRTISFVNQLKFGVVSVVDLTNRIIQKNNILLGHVFDSKHETFLRLENESFRNANPNFTDVKSLWDTVIVNYVGKLDKTTKFGLQASLNLRDNSLKKVEVVVQKFIPEQSIVLKAKVNNKYDVAFLFKRAFWGLENLVTLSAGVGVNNANSDKRTIQQGVQLDFNI